MQQIILFILGAGFCTWLMKSKPQFLKLFVVIMALAAVYYLNTGLTEASLMGFFFGIGALVAFFLKSSYGLFLGPLMGRWPEYSNFFLVKGTIADRDRVTTSGSTTSFSQGTFGNVNAHTRNYRVDYDTLHVLQADGTTVQLKDIGMNENNHVGDVVAYGGVKGQNFSFFQNRSRETFSRTRVAGQAEAIFIGIIMCIPVVSEFMLGVMLLASFIRRKGFISERPIPTDMNHCFFALTYHILAIAIAMKTHASGDLGGIFMTYWIVSVLFAVPHVYVWYSDARRFHAFIESKVRELVTG